MQAVTRRIQAVVTPDSIVAAIPVAVVSEANMREHWAAKHRRKKMQQAAVRLWLQTALHRPPFGPPYIVTMTRVGKRALDSDNLAGACKHVRDEVARLLGVNDGDTESASWLYDQRRGDPGIVIQVEPRTRERIKAAVLRACAVNTSGRRKRAEAV